MQNTSFAAFSKFNLFLNFDCTYPKVEQIRSSEALVAGADSKREANFTKFRFSLSCFETSKERHQLLGVRSADSEKRAREKRSSLARYAK